MMDEFYKEEYYTEVYNAISLILQSRKIMSQQISNMEKLKVPIDDILHEIDGLPASGETQGFEIMDIIKKFAYR